MVLIPEPTTLEWGPVPMYLGGDRAGFEEMGLCCQRRGIWAARVPQHPNAPTPSPHEMYPDHGLRSGFGLLSLTSTSESYSTQETPFPCVTSALSLVFQGPLGLDGKPVSDDRATLGGPVMGCHCGIGSDRRAPECKGHWEPGSAQREAI